MGYITTAISIDEDLWNEMEKMRAIEGANRSFFFQSAMRMKIQSIKKQNISSLLESMSDDELSMLKNEIKKRG